VRCLAWILDFIVILIAINVLSMLGQVGGLISEDFAQAVSIVGYFVISVGYGVLFEWIWRGQTLGKRLLRLRVMDAQGLRLQFHQVLLRNLMRFVDSIPLVYLVGGLACFFSRRAQRLGDIAASTVVVYNPKPSEPDLDQLLSGKFNSLRQHPHLEARLRQRVSPDEARLALQAIIRRDELDPAPRVALFADLAEHFKSLVVFPPESIEAMPDEQYVRNVVDILFRTRATDAKPPARELAEAMR
jgi:uncharacterized RDD family membrane protein YckC